MKLLLQLAVVISCTIVVAGCHNDAASETATLELQDGTNVVYERAGGGDTAVVFVHCWACSRDFWRDQIDAVASAGYAVVTVDLPGHGASGADREIWKVTDYAADLQGLIEHLQLQRVILVGHSMGGPVSLLTASRMPGRVAGVGCVDTLHNAEYTWQEGMMQAFEQMLRNDFRASLDLLFPRMFPPGSDPAILARVTEQAVASDQEAMIQLMVSFEQVDTAALFKAAGVPIRCINAAPWGPEAATTETGINQRYADYDVVLMEGVGHYPQLEQPERFNRHLLEVLATLDQDS